MGAIRDAWLRWKMLKLPWRKKFLIGQDLQGNTFWEFKDVLNHNNLRRIVKPRRKMYHSDVKLSPQWHQWLRHTRMDPPSIQEQSDDVLRHSQLQQNAKLADARWEAKAKYIEAPKKKGTTTQELEAMQKEEKEKKGRDTASTPGSKWQPEAWTPGAARPR